MGILSDFFTRIIRKNDDDNRFLTFFLLNKLTLPVLQSATISHASALDITQLREVFGDEFTYEQMHHIKYKCFWRLKYKSQTVAIVEESPEYDFDEIFKLMMVIYNSEPNDWVRKTKTGNVIEVDFTRKV